MKGLSSQFKNIIHRSILAPLSLRILVAAMLGGIVGLATFTFIYGQGYAYLSDNPEACANCHIMRDYYDRWNHSSHRAVATCNDCHSPHTFIAKYTAKGTNGFNHGLAFTLDNFPEPIQIKSFNRDIVLESCFYCHRALVEAMGYQESQEQTDCLRCHTNTGH
jgi:cytochrome c nitrite reductase small subunit